MTTSDSLGPGPDDLHDLREGVGEDGEAADDEEDDEDAAEVGLGGDVPVADGGHGDDHVVEGGEVGQVGVGVVLVVVPRVAVVLEEEAEARAEKHLQDCCRGVKRRQRTAEFRDGRAQGAKMSF